MTLAFLERHAERDRERLRRPSCPPRDTRPEFACAEPAITSRQRTEPKAAAARGGGRAARAGRHPVLLPPVRAAGHSLLRQRSAHPSGRALPRAGDVPQLDPILQLSRGLRSATRRKLREEGLFTVLGAFDHPSLAGTHRTSELEETFEPRALILKLSTGEELETRRDLSAFVGSVYLPCRCGEVRSVFVPPVTVCEPAP